MHHAVANGGDLQPRKDRVQRRQSFLQGRPVVRKIAGNSRHYDVRPRRIAQPQHPFAADAVHQPGRQGHLTHRAIKRQFQRRRPRIQRQNRPLGHAAPSALMPRRRASCSAATAQDASRDMVLSDREVRMTGTFAPRTSPALSA